MNLDENIQKGSDELIKELKLLKKDLLEENPKVY